MAIANIPTWLTVLSVVSLVVAGLCALVVAIDILAGHRQHMWVMNVVWPVRALYAGVLGLWAYVKVGRLSTHQPMKEAKQRDEEPGAKHKPFWQSAGLAATHCGSGCTLGDLLAEGRLIRWKP